LNKSELIDIIASECGLTKADAKRALDSLLDCMARSLKKGDTVQLVGFGTFGVRKRKARMGVNPRTGQKISIKATRVPFFKAGSELKKAVL